jgi:hypothetical protein
VGGFGLPTSIPDAFFGASLQVAVAEGSAPRAPHHPRSGPFSVNESSDTTGHKSIRCRRVNHRRRKCLLTALLSARESVWFVNVGRRRRCSVGVGGHRRFLLVVIALPLRRVTARKAGARRTRNGGSMLVYCYAATASLYGPSARGIPAGPPCRCHALCGSRGRQFP